jgi:membrane AbrB-like protein
MIRARFLTRAIVRNAFPPHHAALKINNIRIMFRRVAPSLGGLIVSAIGGAICVWLKTPLPWMIGPLVGMAIFQFSGADLSAPPLARELGQFIIAIALGLYFTPSVAREVAANWAVLLAAAFASILIGCIAALFLAATAKVDQATAYFASIPGGAAEMANLSERFNASVECVAVAHSLRILLVVVTIPLAMTFFGGNGTDDYRPVLIPLDWGKLLLMFAIVSLFGFAFQWIRFPNCWMMGPLVGAIALTASGFEFSSMPGWLSSVAQLLLGCALGSRFRQSFLRDAPRFVACLIPSIYLTMGIAALVGWGLAQAAGVSVQTMILATAPGGIAEMSITAKVLKLGVALVTSAHVTRVMIILTFTLPVYKLLQRWGKH